MKEAAYEQIVAANVAAKTVELGRQLCRFPIEGETLDAILETYIRDSGCTPALKGYKPPFTEQIYNHTICLSLNNEAVHGVPKKLVTPHDLITIDLVVEFNGWFADTARTFTWSIDKDGKKDFCIASQAILDCALESIYPKAHLNKFGQGVEIGVDLAGYGIIKEFCGHGIGEAIHKEPQIPNYNHGTQLRFEPGQSYALEPILTLKRLYKLFELNDNWTMSANCLTSHFEDTIFISDDKIVNLTKLSQEQIL